MQHSVELVMMQAREVAPTAAFYVEALGFEHLGGDADGATLQRGSLQLVIQRDPEFTPASGPRVHVPVELPTLESVWEHDRASNPDLPGPQLAAGGIFEYLTRDPARNVVRLKAPIPTSAPPTPR